MRAALEAQFECPPTDAALASAAAGDIVVIESRATAAQCAALPTGHAFGAVSVLKNVRGLIVYVVVDESDPIGAQLARFCLADGVLTVPACGELDVSVLRTSTPAARRAPVDALLARLQGRLQPGQEVDSNLQRLLRFEREDSLLNRLQDEETGLFGGAYATLKLDEEWKRSMRFHQPLSLILLDLGPGIERLEPARRRAVFAEAAGIFLNECRDIDVLARFAPTVFMFLLPGTGPDGAARLAMRMLDMLRERLVDVPGLRPACGVSSVPSSDIPDRRAFLAVAEACLHRAEESGAGGLSTTWQ